MKKFYTLIATAAVALSAAATPTLVSNPSFTRVIANDANSLAESTLMAPAKAVAVAPTGTYNVVGTGVASEGFLNDINSEFALYEESMPATTWEITIEQSATDASWYRTKLYNENSPLYNILEESFDDYFYFNVADPTKVYSTSFVVGGEWEILQCNEESGIGGMLANPDAFWASNPATYGTLENGLLTFPANSFYFLNRAAGRFQNIDLLGSFRIAMPDTQMPDFFTIYDEVSFVDGIFGSLLVITYQDGSKEYGPFESKVTVKEVIGKPGLVYILNPWEYWFESTYPLVIDCFSDAENGYLEAQPTGIEWNAYGPASIIAVGHGFNGTRVDGEFIKYNAETRVITIQNQAILFGFPNSNGVAPNPDPSSWYIMSDEESYASTLSLPELAGVESVVVTDNTNAPREYYNLQGIRVANPENGLYIVRQGNKSHKVYVR